MNSDSLINLQLPSNDSYSSCSEDRVIVVFILTESGGARVNGVTVDLRDWGPSALSLLHKVSQLLITSVNLPLSSPSSTCNPWTENISNGEIKWRRQSSVRAMYLVDWNKGWYMVGTLREMVGSGPHSRNGVVKPLYKFRSQSICHFYLVFYIILEIQTMLYLISPWLVKPKFEKNRMFSCNSLKKKWA